MTKERLAEIKALCEPAGWEGRPPPGEGNLFYKQDIWDLLARVEELEAAVRREALEECRKIAAGHSGLLNTVENAIGYTAACLEISYAIRALLEPATEENAALAAIEQESKT